MIIKSQNEHTKIKRFTQLVLKTGGFTNTLVLLHVPELC